jgi:hypothetical protein
LGENISISEQHIMTVKSPQQYETLGPNSYIYRSTILRPMFGSSDFKLSSTVRQIPTSEMLKWESEYLRPD